MKAMLIDEKKNLVWSDVSDPVAKPDEVLVRIHAAALNRADLLQREGKYPSPAGCPEWMGLEIENIPADYVLADTERGLRMDEYIKKHNL